MDQGRLAVLVNVEEVPVNEMIFWGGRGQAKVLRECMMESGLRLVAIFDNDRELKALFDDVPLYYGKEELQLWLEKKRDTAQIGFLVAIGGAHGKERVALQDYLQAQHLRPLVARHRSAFVAQNAVVGDGSQILAMAAVCVDAVLGRACIVNTSATIDHDCTIGDGVHIGPGVHLGGSVRVCDFATIYTGAVVLPKLVIGKGAVVGAGSVITKDVPDNVVVVGNPAKIIEQTL
jgi:sugar O-acyltransferase (sialic acid O-acetyltransferase NeuD family)